MGRLYHNIIFSDIIFYAGVVVATITVSVADAVGIPSAVDPTRIAASRSFNRHSSGGKLCHRHPRESGFVVELGRPDAI